MCVECTSPGQSFVSVGNDSSLVELDTGVVVVRGMRESVIKPLLPYEPGAVSMTTRCQQTKLLVYKHIPLCGAGVSLVSKVVIQSSVTSLFLR